MQEQATADVQMHCGRVAPRSSDASLRAWQPAGQVTPGKNGGVVDALLVERRCSCFRALHPTAGRDPQPVMEIWSSPVAT